ncbi:MAG: signal recognition particle protein [Proteobacteria bacterium]|nr:signal recognition particle protein [Pseudomonadota bacterium]
MFNNLINGFNKILDRLKKPGTVRERDIEAVLDDLKISLLEADVHYDVVNQFLSTVREKSLGAQVHKALSPSQQILKIIHEELTTLLGSKSVGLSFKGTPSVIMLVGLQGSGKTTTAIKLAKYFKEQLKRKPVVVGVDFNRPAAVEQLKILAESNGIDVCNAKTRNAPKAVKEAKELAAKNGNDTVIIDTAGRLHIDKELMDELKELKNDFNPSEILLVADSMLGQDAVNVAREFDGLLDLSGFILTKLDSDTRGGAALSLFNTTGKPIKFMGFGEKVSELEVFHPDRIASRILDLGDMMTLIEKAESHFDKEEAIKLEKKLRKNTFDIDDFKDQLKQIKKLGSLSGLMSMIPGASGMMGKLQGMTHPDEELKKIESMINSMTKKERQLPDIINGNRRKRIALGSGTTVNDVNKFLKSFDHMKKLMKHLPKSGFSGLGI